MDKELICLDTSILIDYFRKRNKSKTHFFKLSSEFDFAISVITKLEILAGIKKEQEDFWINIFKRIKILELSEKDVEIAAEIIKSLKKKNQIIGMKDILIASTAIAKGLTLATLNVKEFERIDNLHLIER